jgi:pilus assembly protein Flp/PilA
LGETESDGRLSHAAGRRAARGLAAGPLVAAFLADRRGATAIEYSLICALIFTVVITAVSAFANGTTGIMNTISAAVTGAM